MPYVLKYDSNLMGGTRPLVYIRSVKSPCSSAGANSDNS